MAKATNVSKNATTKASWYGSHDSMLDAALLRGNIGRVLKSKEGVKSFICLTGEKKSDVTRGLKGLCGADAQIEYHNPIVCRKRKGAIVEIDGVTRIWVGVVEGQAKEVKATKPAPKKATTKKVVTKKVTKEPELNKEEVLAQLAAMQEQIRQLAEVL